MLQITQRHMAFGDQRQRTARSSRFTLIELFVVIMTQDSEGRFAASLAKGRSRAEGVVYLSNPGRSPWDGPSTPHNNDWFLLSMTLVRLLGSHGLSLMNYGERRHQHFISLGNIPTIGPVSWGRHPTVTTARISNAQVTYA